MKLIINIPTRDEIIKNGIIVLVAKKTQSWSSKQLNSYADKQGVYILHCNDTILYVGQTTQGKFGNFGERLRREFQETSSSNSLVHQILSEQKESIKASFLDLDNINEMFKSNNIQLSNTRKALIVEQILIGQYKPRGNIS